MQTIIHRLDKQGPTASAGNSIQYPGIKHNGKEFLGEERERDGNDGSAEGPGWLESHCMPESHVGTSGTHQESVHWAGAGSALPLSTEQEQNSTPTCTPLFLRKLCAYRRLFLKGQLPRRGITASGSRNTAKALNMDSQITFQFTLLPED